jgi:hypothetical protein
MTLDSMLIFTILTAIFFVYALYLSFKDVHEHINLIGFRNIKPKNLFIYLCPIIVFGSGLVILVLEICKKLQ